MLMSVCVSRNSLLFLLALHVGLAASPSTLLCSPCHGGVILSMVFFWAFALPTPSLSPAPPLQTVPSVAGAHSSRHSVGGRKGPLMSQGGWAASCRVPTWALQRRWSRPAMKKTAPWCSCGWAGRVSTWVGRELPSRARNTRERRDGLEPSLRCAEKRACRARPVRVSTLHGRAACSPII